MSVVLSVLVLGAAGAACTRGSDPAPQSSPRPGASGAATTPPRVTLAPATFAPDALALLRPDGLGGIDFGTPKEQAMTDLGAVFREVPVTTDRSCALGAMQIVAWPGMDVSFVDGTFRGYRYTDAAGAEPATPGLRTPTGIGLGSTAAELRSVYGPSVTISNAEGSYLWQVDGPDGVGGALSRAPERGGVVTAISAGRICPN